MTFAKKFLLGAAMMAATLGMTAAPAQAARIGVYIGARAAYVPPCPGPGYGWVDGYWNDGNWLPGYWNFVGYGHGVPVYRGPMVVDRGAYAYHRDFDRDDHRYWDRDRDRHFDRDDRHFDRNDHFRR